eukprot:SAG11_NODE_3391_length_2478_cov_2.624632_3_plen_228_part_00
MEFLRSCRCSCRRAQGISSKLLLQLPAMLSALPNRPAPMRSLVVAICSAQFGAAAAQAAVDTAVPFAPILFMDPASDAVDPWGLQMGAPSRLARNASLAPPPCNYSAGDTVFAAFSAAGGGYEVFVAVGRPGEPLLRRRAAVSERRRSKPPPPPPPPMPPGSGVAVKRYVTHDFNSYVRTVGGRAAASSPSPPAHLRAARHPAALATRTRAHGAPLKLRLLLCRARR